MFVSDFWHFLAGMDVSNTSNWKKLLQAIYFSEVDTVTYFFNNIFQRWGSCFVIFILTCKDQNLFRQFNYVICSCKFYVQTQETVLLLIKYHLPSSNLLPFWIAIFHWRTLFGIHKRKCGRWYKEKSHVIQEMQYGHNATKTQGLGNIRI